MTAHELARQLFKMPDVTIIGDSVAEGESAPLTAALLSMDGERVCLVFYPLDLNHENIEREYGPQ